MKKIFLPLLLVVIVSIVALTVFPVQANPGTLYVAPGGNCGGATPCYGTIQAAVNASVNGDEIRVASGTYSTVSTAVYQASGTGVAPAGGSSIRPFSSYQMHEPSRAEHTATYGTKRSDSCNKEPGSLKSATDLQPP